MCGNLYSAYYKTVYGTEVFVCFVIADSPAEAKEEVKNKYLYQEASVEVYNCNEALLEVLKSKEK